MNSRWVAGDAAGAGEAFAEDAVLAGADGEPACEGRAAIQEALLEELEATRLRAFEEAEDPLVRVWGDTALVRYDFHARGFEGGRTRDWEGEELLVLARLGGRWRIAWRQRR